MCFGKRNKQRRRYIVIYEALSFDVAQGRMNGAPNETRTHSCRFARQACTQRCPKAQIYKTAFEFDWKMIKFQIAAKNTLWSLLLGIKIRRALNCGVMASLLVSSINYCWIGILIITKWLILAASDTHLV